jgi:hypothetical protein
MQDLLPKSITERALNFMAQGQEPIEAVKLAFQEEENFIASMLSGSFLSKKGHSVAAILSKSVYDKINNRPFP